MCTKEGTEVPSLNTGGFSVSSMNKTGGRRKMFITRANLASSFSSPFFRVTWHCDYVFRSDSFYFGKKLGFLESGKLNLWSYTIPPNPPPPPKKTFLFVFRNIDG